MKKKTIAIIGLGYVGLPLAVEFGKKYLTIGFDINKKRIQEISKNTDSTFQIKAEEIKSASQLITSSKISDLAQAQIYIITVPTPVDDDKNPDLTFIKKATQTVAKVLNKNDIVIYESTVYPGVTEEFCIPILEKETNLKFNSDFFAGYSPERINPGDKKRCLTNIIKITSGSTPEIAEEINLLYKSIITKGTYQASSIKVAEAAKVIENTQRDLNIALLNEFAIIFNYLKIDTKEILEAAATKWNFLNFQPGLVGGHCIGVDPYYIAYCAKQVGYDPKLILAGRHINDNITSFIASSIIKLMLKKKININKSKILILGLTFKENCTDIRNTKVINLIKEFLDYNIKIDIYDPYANSQEVMKEYSLELIDKPKPKAYDAIILATKHQQFIELGGKKIRQKFAKENSIIYDIKSVFDKKDIDGRL